MAKRKTKRNEPEIRKMIERHGWECRKLRDALMVTLNIRCPHCGRPSTHKKLAWQSETPYDLKGEILGVSVPIEVKWAEKRFPFANEESGIRPKQREHLTGWQQKHKHPTWLALTMGTGRVNSMSDPHRRRTWLVPWNVWLEVEQKLLALNFKSLPMSPDTTNRQDLLRNELTAVQALAPYELKWKKWPDGSGWAVPQEHAFARSYELSFFPN